MVCSFCMHRFEESEGYKACSTCATFGGCRKIKCPRCGYEMPQTPDLAKLFARLLRKSRVRSR